MLKIVLSGRGLALTVQLFGRAAGGCGLCAETLALLALGILALEESLTGGLVRLGRGERVYLNSMGFLRFVVVEIDDFTFSEVFGCAGIRAEPFSKSTVALVDKT